MSQQNTSMSNNSTHNNDAQNHGHVFTSSEKTNAVFKSAFRHSRNVRRFKIALPIIAIIIAAIFIWFTFFSVDLPQETMVLNGNWSDDELVTMTQPKLEGYTKGNQHYSMAAERAVQLTDESGMIQLKEIVAKVPMATRGHATVTALNGFYDNINGRMKFDKPFTVTTTDGMIAKIMSADINIESSQIDTSQPVDIVRGPQHLTADSMHVKDNGSVIVFNGNVHLVIDNEIEQ